jgi:hypothetical protein
MRRLWFTDWGKSFLVEVEQTLTREQIETLTANDAARRFAASLRDPTEMAPVLNWITELLGKVVRARAKTNAK